jgi:hypothetical protein
MALILAVPDEYFALAFGTEWLVDRRRPLGAAEAPRTDVFADVGAGAGATGPAPDRRSGTSAP